MFWRRERLPADFSSNVRFSSSRKANHNQNQFRRAYHPKHRMRASLHQNISHNVHLPILPFSVLALKKSHFPVPGVLFCHPALSTRPKKRPVNVQLSETLRTNPGLGYSFMVGNSSRSFSFTIRGMGRFFSKVVVVVEEVAIQAQASNNLRACLCACLCAFIFLNERASCLGKPI